MKSTWLAPLVFVFAACASVPKHDITMAPKIETNRLSAPQLAFLQTRDIRIVVNDQRSLPYHLNSDQTVAELTRALTEVFEHQGFTVSPAATQVASMDIQDDVDPSATRANDVRVQSYCVKISGDLQLPGQRFINAKASSCHEVKVGVQRGGDISRAYEKALNLIFEKWDELGTQTFGRI